MIKLPVRAGFTLIEVLISVAIISLLTGLTIAGYGTFNKKQTVKTAAHQLASNLRLAQQKAVSGEKPVVCADGYLEGWEIVILPDSYYSMASCSFSSSPPPSSPTIFFPANVTSSVGRAEIIKFTALTGAVSGGDGTYTLTGNFSGTSYFNTIEITPSGGINVN